MQQFSDSAFSVLPALVTIGLAIITHRVLLSIGLGAILGALMLHQFSPIPALIYLKDAFLSHFISGEGIVFDNVNIISFLFLMGVMIQLMAMVGATEAFAQWASSYAKSRRSAKWLICIMALIFFIDDYFHSLAAGNISRPIADQYRISRAKLAYLLDSTAAPICVVTPVSSWGAYIIALIGGIFASQGITEFSSLGAFLSMVPMIYYTFFTLLMIGLVAFFDLNIGGMYREELRVAQSDRTSEEAVSGEGSLWLLIAPITLTTLGTVCMIFYTGAQSMEQFSVFGALEKTDMALSLITGAFLGISVLCVEIVKRKVRLRDFASRSWKGCCSMWPAVSILIFAWTIGSVIGDLGTGTFLASLVNSHIPLPLLPCLVFLLSGFMAFSTGTSWGTFGIMLPLAAQIALSGESTLLLPLLSAVLSGAVFGDHCSPISDTTILSASGAGCHHMIHVLTQLPYALIAAFLTAIAYLTLGYTGSVALGIVVGSLCYVVIAAILVMNRRKICYEQTSS